jgi:hypothetical protein
MVTFWEGELEVVEPTKLRDAGAATRAGLETVSFTVTVVVGFMAPGADMVRCPVYVPTAMPAWFTVTSNEADVVPEVGLVSQLESLLTEKARPAVVEEMLRLWAAGAVLPTAPAKLSDAGETVSWLVEG